MVDHVTSIHASKHLVFKSHVHWIATFAVFLLLMQLGISIGWAAPNIIKLTTQGSDILLTKDQASWTVSILFLVGIGGALVGALGVEFAGSRRSILAAFLIISISWLCMILADSVIWLYVSRGLAGIVLAIGYSCFSLYLGEIAEPRMRGTMISVAASGNPFGVIIGIVAETYLSRLASSSIYLAQSLVALLILIWLHDTPYFLLSKGKVDAARASVAFYHPAGDVERELADIKSFVESHQQLAGGANKTICDKLRDLNAPIVWKSLFLILTLFALPHLSGTLTIISYMRVILKDGKFDLINPENFVIYANVISLVSILSTSKLIDVFGRRVLLAISGLGTAAGMLGLAVNFYLLEHGYNTASSLQWLQFACIIGYLVAYAIGFTSVPSAVLGELFTDNVKSTAALLASLAAPFFSFIVSKAYQPMVDSMGQTYVFGIHGLFSFLAVPFAVFLLPETKGKTFQEIQDALGKTS